MKRLYRLSPQSLAVIVLAVSTSAGAQSFHSSVLEPSTDVPQGTLAMNDGTDSVFVGLATTANNWSVYNLVNGTPHLVSGSGGSGNCTNLMYGGSQIGGTTSGGKTDIFWMFASGPWLGHASSTNPYGGVWTCEELDGPHSIFTNHSNAYFWSPAALTLSGQPNVWYYESYTGDLRHAIFNGVTWSIGVEDGPTGNAGHSLISRGVTTFPGRMTAVVAAFSGNPVVFYYDATTKSLRRRFIGLANQPNFENVDGAASGFANHVNDDVGTDIVALFVPARIGGGTLHVFYHAVLSQTTVIGTTTHPAGDEVIRHAQTSNANGGGWTYQYIDASLPSYSILGPNIFSSGLSGFFPPASATWSIFYPSADESKYLMTSGHDQVITMLNTVVNNTGTVPPLTIESSGAMIDGNGTGLFTIFETIGAQAGHNSSPLWFTQFF